MFRISSLFRIILLVAMMPISMVVSAQGQEECQYDQLTVEITSTESTCQRNGSLTFHLRGAHVKNYQNFTYEVRSMVLGGVNIPETAGEVSADGEGRTIANLPSGLYRVIVRATCIADPTYTLQDFILENVQVPGNYMVPNVYFDAAKSRGAYTGCPTGKIVLDVTGGRGNFTFKVVKSPGDAHNEVVTPIKTGTSYALPYEQYPAGEYSIEVHDVDCDYTAVTNFQLTEYTASDLPTLQNESYTAFRPILKPGPDCHAVRIYTSVHENFYKGRPSVIAAIQSGAYELGLSPPNEEPTAWVPLSIYGEQIASLGTHKLHEFYDNNSLKATIRLKACPTIKRSFLSYLRHPFTSDITNHCGYSVISPRPWTDYDGHYCFPLTVSVYPDEAAYNANPNNPLETKVLQKHDDRVPTTVQGGESRFFVIKDADNNILQKQTLSAPRLEFYREWTYDRLSCDGFYAWFGYRGAVCEGVVYSVYNIEDPAHPVLLCENQTPGQQVGCLLPYETNLRAILTAPMPDGTVVSVTMDFREPRPNFNVRLTYTNIDYCLVNVAQLRMYTDPRKYLPPGTRMRITGPNGFIQEHTLTSYNYEWYFPAARLDPGEYTLEVWLGDCYHKTFTYDITTLLDVKSFSVPYAERDCAQMKVKPKGLVIFQNAERPGETYFRIASGPEGGYDPSARLSQTQIDNGGYFGLTKPGTYMVGISYQNNCVFQQIPVEFERTNLRLDNLRTIAFACQNNSSLGHIYVKATEGYGEYSYVLYDEDNEDELDDSPSVDGDRVHFQHGEQGDVYTVRIQDECGNRFSQQITILDLSKQTIGSAVRGTVCVGDVIEFTSLPVGTYKWEKETAPGSNVYTFFSSEQNPTIPDAKPSHSGRYRVTVEATGCTGTSVGYVNINVVPCYAPVNPSLMNKYGNF